MRRPAGALLVGLLAALLARPEAASAGDEARERKDLPPGGATELSVLDLGGPKALEVVCDQKLVVVRATPDGIVELLEANVPVNVMVIGVEGNRASFVLRQGDRVSVWPVSLVEIRGRAEAMLASVSAADWAFVVRVEEAQGNKLSVQCDGIQCELRAGQRIDIDREGEKTVFRAIGQAWPGRLVEAPSEGPRPEEPPRPTPPPFVDTVASAVLPLPYIATGWGAWEVRAALPVSP